MLPADDATYLAQIGIIHTISSEGNMICIVFPKFPLPTGYDRPQSDLLIRLSAGYPDVPPDMWWFDPPVRRADGQQIPATNAIEHYLGRGWQRWSRHFQPGQWKSGIDGIESFLALIRSELRRAAPVAVR